MNVEYGPYGITAQFALQNKPPGLIWEWTRTTNSEVKVTSQALLPNTSIISFTLNMGVSFITFVNTVPISETRSINRFCLVRNFALSKELDSIAVKGNTNLVAHITIIVELGVEHFLYTYIVVSLCFGTLYEITT